MTELSDNLANFKILVVDDEKEMREFLKVSLEGKGVNNIWEAENGREALSLIKLQNFDLIICDWRMPVMDGLQLLEEVRKLANRKDTPFLMATSLNDAEHVASAIKAGVNDYLTKPLDPDTIYKKVLANYEKKQQKLAASEPQWMSKK